jgi:hypothetical protein
VKERASAEVDGRMEALLAEAEAYFMGEKEESIERRSRSHGV